MQKLLVTGGAGFIGSHCIVFILKKYPDYYIVNLDKLTYASRISFAYQKKPNYYFLKGYVTNFLLVTKLFYQFNFDGVIHLAAESHLDRSIVAINCSSFYKDECRGYWGAIPCRL